MPRAGLVERSMIKKIRWMCSKYREQGINIPNKQQQSLYSKRSGLIVWIMFFHSVLVRVMSSITLRKYISFFSTSKFKPCSSSSTSSPSVSINYYITAPHGSIYWSVLHSPNHLNQFYVILSSIDVTSSFQQIHSFLLSSFNVLSLIHLSILTSVTLAFWTCCFLVVQHSSSIKHGW